MEIRKYYVRTNGRTWQGDRDACAPKNEIALNYNTFFFVFFAIICANIYDIYLAMLEISQIFAQINDTTICGARKTVNIYKKSSTMLEIS